MSFNILIDSSLSLLEYAYLGLTMTTSLFDYRYVVNPTNRYLTNKIIIVNVPDLSGLNLLSKSNKIISRFPIDCDNYVLEPYDLTKEIRFKCSYLTSQYILTPKLLTKSNTIVYDSLNDCIVLDRYLLSEDLMTSNYLNCAGYVDKKLKEVL